MTTKNDGGLVGGLTKREAYAMAAIQGLLANSGGPVQANGNNGWGLVNCEPKDVAKLAYEMADAMLAARENP